MKEVALLTKLPYLKEAGQAVFKDSGIQKFSDVITQWNGQDISGFGMIGAPLSKSSISDSGASFAPGVMRKILNSMATYAVEDDVDLIDIPLFDIGDISMHITDMTESHNRIETTLFHLLEGNPKLIPLIFGGDHSISAPTIKGFAQAKGKIGVIQFDAHHDIRNLQDGGPSNGTPFRNLIDSGVLKGEHLYQIGIRNFANSKTYYDQSQEFGIHVYTMKDVRKWGVLTLVQEAYKQLSNEVDAIYLSVDIDVIDQAFAPGCPAVSPGGMVPDELFLGIKWLGEQEGTMAIDIVEIDPKQDFREMTSKIGVFSLLSFLIGKKRLMG